MKRLDKHAHSGSISAPAWQKCPDCDDFWCSIHFMHVADCDCPPIEEWETDPYGNQEQGPAAGRDGLEVLE